MKKIVLAIGAGALAYVIYNNRKKGSKQTGSQELPSKSESNPGSNLTSYQAKVMRLQKLLAVATDGIPGKQTNGTLEYWYSKGYESLADAISNGFKNNYPNLKTNGKGVISSSNVDFYIQQYENRQTPRQLRYVSQSQTAMSQDALSRKSFGQKLLSTNLPVKAIQPTTIAIRYYDASRNIYTPTGSTWVMPKDYNLLSNYKFVAFDVDGWMILKSNSGLSYIVVNPYNFKY